MASPSSTVKLAPVIPSSKVPVPLIVRVAPETKLISPDCEVTASLKLRSGDSESKVVFVNVVLTFNSKFPLNVKPLSVDAEFSTVTS